VKLQLRKYLITVALLIATTAVQWLVWPWIEPAPWLLFYPMIIVASLYGDGISFVLLSAWIGQFVFITSLDSLEMNWPIDHIRITIYTLSGFLIRGIASKLSKSEQRFLTTLVSIGDAVIATDREGRITFMNPVAEELTEWNAKEAVWLPLDKVFKIINDETGQPANDPVEKVIREGVTVGLANHTTLVGRKGKRSAIEDSAAPIRNSVDRHIEGAVLVFRDASEKYAQNRVLRDTARRLESAVRVRDDFLSIASHELKTPLTALKLQAQMQQRNLSKGNLEAFRPEGLKRALDSEVRQINQLNRLIDDMLDISRINTGKLTIERERFDLCELAQEVIERFAAQFKASACDLSIECCDPVVGNWDRFRIEQVIANLLTNALKYGSGKPVHISAVRDGDMAKLTVKDHGMGIAPEDLERVFQRFERAVPSASISGLGLGLFIARQIVEMHGGRLSAESEVGKGSAFIVELPIA
jgi:PAS domain S-box-containing protein